MAKELIFTERFKKNFKNLPLGFQKRFDKKLDLFLANPRHPSLNIHRYLGIVFRNIGPHKIIDGGDV